jgi:DNA-binding transcriptional MerR regulator
MARKQNNNQNNKEVAVKEIMSRYNLTYQTVNHYTDLGLLPLAFKKGNVRFYDSNKVKQRLATITALTREGYSLRLIRKKLLGV